MLVCHPQNARATCRDNQLMSVIMHLSASHLIQAREQETIDSNDAASLNGAPGTKTVSVIMQSGLLRHLARHLRLLYRPRLPIVAQYSDG